MASYVIFLLGLAVLLGFFWYLATDSLKVKRFVGTVLAISITAASIYFFEKLGIKKGIELQGGVSFQVQIQGVGDKPVTPQAQQEAIKVLERRINAGGTEELLIAPQGEDRIFIQIPGVGEERVKEITTEIERAARLELSLVHERSAMLVGQVVAGAHVEPSWQATPAANPGEDDPTHYLTKIRPDMSGDIVSGARAEYSPRGWVILVDFNPEASNQFGELSKNYGRQLAIIMDGEVLSAPGFNSGKPIYGTCEISGRFTQEEALALASALENPLQNPVKVLSSNQISPTMGAATVKQGVTAGVAGLTITLLFILVYYRVAGFLALLGLCINIAVLFGAMSLFQFTLTLPGIAGIILTIGIAIDANVLIYERLREEMAMGKSLPAAVRTAYEKALSAIIDANLTTLITAIILYIVATGTVKGFAITLIVGILSSLFSALLVTRICFNWLVDTGMLKKMSFLSLVPDKSFDFLGKRQVFLTISAVVVVGSLILTPLRDPRGVDLKGGDLITVQSDSQKALTVDQIEAALAETDLPAAPTVQEQAPLGSEDVFFSIRSAEDTAETIKTSLGQQLGIDAEHFEVESVGSLIGSEMLRVSMIALGLGLIAILIYVTVRFEFAFALGAIVALFHDLIITLGIVTLLGREISLITVGAFLTIAGYSINDTIVVFDRVREGLRSKRGDVKDIINFSLNRTLARTLLTSFTTLVTVITLLLFGGPALSNFALTILIGVLIGTYSSIYVASPIVLWWARRTNTNLRREVLESDQAKVAPAAQPGGAT